MRLKQKRKVYKKSVVIFILMLGVAASTVYHTQLAHKLLAQQANAATKVGQWLNQDGTPCELIGGDWICKPPTGKAKKEVALKVKSTSFKTVTAYNSVPEQTDGSPCIAAYNDNICELEKKGDHSCAAAYPYKTKLGIPGKGTCTVRDVLAPKYAHRVDWYEGGADKIDEAFNWGKRDLNITIYEN